MTTAAPEKDELRRAAWGAIKRMKAAWPAWSWSDEMTAEYGRALVAVGDADLIEEGTTQAIRQRPGKYPPPIADTLQVIGALKRDRAAGERANSGHHRQSACQGPACNIGWAALPSCGEFIDGIE